VRVHQEAFMEVCWNQVGQVLDANEALSRARLALEAARRLHERHFQPVPADVLTQLAAPLHARVSHGALTVRRALRDSSVPDATTDAAMRRATSGQRPFAAGAPPRPGGATILSAGSADAFARGRAAGRDPGASPGRPGSSSWASADTARNPLPISRPSVPMRPTRTSCSC
jgi:hypothetical protein